LEGTFNEAAQNLQLGPNQAGGAKFAALLRGNKQQSDNLRTLITESAGMQAYQGFERVLDVLEAQGTRQAMGSQTAQNAQFQRQLAEGGPLAAGKLIFKPSEVANKYEEFQMGRNANKLADMLTSKDGVEKLKELARTKPTVAKAQTILNSIIGGAVSQKSEIKEESK
jgi:tRNA nucleotidyltransferase/poly(A) polymerase